jgi:transcriptional antiterminator RfaH
MTWYLIQTKPRQELIAKENLSNQGYECFLPMLHSEKIVRKALSILAAPLFPRYLFIQLDKDFGSKSWSPIRSTRGVSNLVRFGIEPAKVPDELVNFMRQRAQNYKWVKPLFESGQSIKIHSGPFANFEAIYQGMDANQRIIVLLEFMGKLVVSHVELEAVRTVVSP